MTPTRRLAALAAAVLALTACGSGEDSVSAPADEPRGATVAAIETTTVAVDAVPAATLDEPTALEQRPGDDHLWVAERAGLVLRLAVDDDGGLTAAGDAVLDLTDRTTVDSERGLLGLAFDPTGDLLFVSHTDPDGTSVVAVYDVIDDAVDETSRRELLTVPQPFGNHNGGHVAWGPDDHLWLGLGDGGSADDPDNRAQDPDDPLGSMVRIDPGSGDAEIVVTGLRNPWRFAFDTDGGLWIADVGQSSREEITHLPADDIADANLGWSGFEGTEPHLDGEGRRPDDPVMPVFEYGHDGGNCSITGGVVYRGRAIEELQGSFLFADYCAGRVRAVAIDDDGALTGVSDLGVDVEAPVSFGSDADGEPYVLSGTGDIVRLVPAG